MRDFIEVRERNCALLALSSLFRFSLFNTHRSRSRTAGKKAPPLAQIQTQTDPSKVPRRLRKACAAAAAARGRECSSPPPRLLAARPRSAKDHAAPSCILCFIV